MESVVSDVVVVGGGPAGATVSAKLNPNEVVPPASSKWVSPGCIATEA